MCSSNDVKFSKHIVYPDVHFLNNWEHMRNFVQLLEHPLVDHSVYSRNRCFRMAGCHKFGDETRIFRPGRPSSALVCHPSATPLEFAEVKKTARKGQSRPGVSVGAFRLRLLNVPEGWKSTLSSLEPDDLLRAIHPDQSYQAFFAIGCAYKRAGGSAEFYLVFRLQGQSQSSASMGRLEQA